MAPVKKSFIFLVEVCALLFASCELLCLPSEVESEWWWSWDEALAASAASLWSGIWGVWQQHSITTQRKEPEGADITATSHIQLCWCLQTHTQPKPCKSGGTFTTRCSTNRTYTVLEKSFVGVKMERWMSETQAFSSAWASEPGVEWLTAPLLACAAGHIN